jgi:sugar phosphate isomerase/epimerase
MADMPDIGLVTEPLAHMTLTAMLDWLAANVPEITALEIGTGAYAPTPHCDMNLMLDDAGARRRWLAEIAARGVHVAALNVWGNPLHPDRDIAAAHDAALRQTIRLAAACGVDRIVAMAGCPAAAPADTVPHFAGGGWLPYLENLRDRQWPDVAAYWTDLSAFAQRTHPGLLVCLELHPGTVAYNVATFEQLAALGPAIAANIDPSHFFWMQMDADAVVRRLGARCGHAHGKDVVFQREQLALNGLLDHRWPNPPADMPWNFAVVGRGHDHRWWHDFLARLDEAGRVGTIAIEHEDPFVPPEAGIREAARLLSAALVGASG